MTIREMMVLLCIAIGLTPAFKMKFWNIGAEGQVLAGADVSENGTVFQYENRRQKGAVYNVYAGEDIFSAYGAKIYSKGDLVKENLSTDENGACILELMLSKKCRHRRIFIMPERKRQLHFPMQDRAWR